MPYPAHDKVSRVISYYFCEPERLMVLIMSTKNIMIVGVGGQGTLLASRIIGSALMSKNYDVKISEVHGMSQRGGSVVTYVKYGDEVFSPTVEKGEADILISFEQLEAFRWVE